MSQQPPRPQPFPLHGGNNKAIARLVARSLGVPFEMPDDSAQLEELHRELGYDDVQFPLFTAAELNSGQFETRYLIPGVLAAGRHLRRV